MVKASGILCHRFQLVRLHVASADGHLIVEIHFMERPKYFPNSYEYLFWSVRMNFNLVFRLGIWVNSSNFDVDWPRTQSHTNNYKHLLICSLKCFLWVSRFMTAICSVSRYQMGCSFQCLKLQYASNHVILPKSDPRKCAYRDKCTGFALVSTVL